MAYDTALEDYLARYVEWLAFWSRLKPAKERAFFLPEEIAQVLTDRERESRT